MPYVPLSRIKTDLYTYGGQFELQRNNEEYTGYYHALYDGTYYTGRTPNDTPVEILVPIEAAEQEPYTVFDPAVISRVEDQTDTFELSVAQLEKIDQPAPDVTVEISEYNQVARKGPVKDAQPSVGLTPYNLKPDSEDYQVGEIIRYFAKKLNELYYLEISKETFEELRAQDEKYHWQLYLTFSIPWQIVGSKDQVEQTNFNIVTFTERKKKIQGLQQFLDNNYLKFYKES